jgi:hypothetical protein
MQHFGRKAPRRFDGGILSLVWMWLALAQSVREQELETGHNPRSGQAADCPRD